MVPGGIRTYLENLLWSLAESCPDDELLLFFRGISGGKAPPLPDGAKAKTIQVRAPGRLLHRLENSIGYPKIESWTGGVDVVHGVHFALPATRSDVRRVLTVHDVAYLRHPEYYTDQQLNDYGYHYLLSNALRRADAVIALSHAAKADIAELCEFDPDNIWVVPHGIDPRIGPASPEEQSRVREEHELEGPFAIYPVGTLEVRKNIRRTLEAFRRAFPDATTRPALLLTGVGDAPTEFFEIVDGHGLSGHVKLASVNYPDDLCALLSAAQWGMYPSLYEGFGLPPLEAMACGLPLLVSNASSCPEVAGDAALLVDPEDADEIAEAMIRLHTDATLRAQLAARGRTRAASAGFQWARAARQTRAVYADDRDAYAAEEQPLQPAREPELS